jgi:hypothetical protein
VQAYRSAVVGRGPPPLQSMTSVLRWVLALASSLHVGHAGLYVDNDAHRLAFFRDVLLNKLYNPHPGIMDGGEWPDDGKKANALSMAGQRRLDSFSALVATAVEDGVPGHVIETGVWRGGASFMAAKTLELLRERATGRRVYLADSFKGIPDMASYTAAGSIGEASKREQKKPKPAAASFFSRLFGPKEPKEEWTLDVIAHKFDILNNNSPERVRDDARRMGLDMRRLRFAVGYFNESVRRRARRHPSLWRHHPSLWRHHPHFSAHVKLSALPPAPLRASGFPRHRDCIAHLSCPHHLYLCASAARAAARRARPPVCGRAPRRRHVPFDVRGDCLIAWLSDCLTARRRHVPFDVRGDCLIA